MFDKVALKRLMLLYLGLRCHWLGAGVLRVEG